MGIIQGKLPDRIFEITETFNGKKETTKYKIEQLPTRKALKLMFEIAEFFGLSKVTPFPKQVTSGLVAEFARSDKALEIVDQLLQTVCYEVSGDKGKGWIRLDETQIDIHFTGRHSQLFDLITEVIDFNGFFDLTDKLMIFLPTEMLKEGNPLIEFLMMSGKNG